MGNWPGALLRAFLVLGAGVADNGYLVGGVCSSVVSKAFFVCPSATSYVYIGLAKSTLSPYVFNCLSSSWTTLSSISVSSPDCVVSGPPLTETEQIQAINQLLPYALAFLAAIWGGKKVFDLLWGASFRPRRVSDPE